MLLNVLFSKGRKLGRPSVPMLNLDSPKRERTPAKLKLAEAGYRSIRKFLIVRKLIKLDVH